MTTDVRSRRGIVLGSLPEEGELDRVERKEGRNKTRFKNVFFRPRLSKYSWRARGIKTVKAAENVNFRGRWRRQPVGKLDVAQLDAGSEIALASFVVTQLGGLCSLNRVWLATKLPLRPVASSGK
jgi:hypothetical protein